MLMRFVSTLALLTAAVLAVGFPSPAPAQEPEQAEAPAPKRSVFRKLAPGVEITIAAEMHKEEKQSWHDLIGLLALDSKYGERPWSKNKAKNVELKHDIWSLDFTFKPVRLITVDVPNRRGLFDRKVIWYLYYHVRNPGDKPVKFVPRFLLYLSDRNKYYADRILPVANKPIRTREDARRTILDSVQMSAKEILPSTEGKDNSVWGVATWEDVDPKTDRFTVYVQGLSNAYKMEPVDDKWKYYRKTLQLNFWRPGDEFLENSKEIRYGAPDKLEYEWVYK